MVASLMNHKIFLSRLGALFVVGLFLLSAAARGADSGRAPAENSIRAADLLRSVEILAAPEMEGRGAGTAGEARAADYIAGEFRKIGLKPAGDRGSYFQSFEIALGVKLGAGNRFALGLGGKSVDFKPDESFRPFGSSDEGSFSGAVVFAGYGITAPEMNYDDYDGIDVKDKAVVVMTHEPQEKNPQSPFRSPDAFRYRELRFKILNAREHGARAVIVVTDPNGHGGEREELSALRGGTGASAGIIAVNALRSVAEQMLASAGKKLSALQSEIDESLKPRSFAATGVNVELNVRLVKERGRAKNVVAMLPGKDPKLRAEAIVIGAHYDHLGRGGEHSLAPDQFGAIHPGADDNASGTAAVIALARAFTRSGSRHTLVFAAFSGE